MNINTKTRKTPRVEVQQISTGACFLYGIPEEFYIKTTGEYNTDTHYSISVTRLRDGFENRFKKTTMVQPIGATVNVEE